MGCAPSRNVAKPTETEDTAAGKRTARVNPQQNETTSESEGATTSLAPTCPAPHAFRVLSIADQRKKSKVSISALFRVGHRNSVFVNEPEPEGTLAPKRPARRGSSIDTDRTPFHRDISLRGSKGIYFPPGATEISGMTLKTLLAEPSTCKTFVRFLSHRDSTYGITHDHSCIIA